MVVSRVLPLWDGPVVDPGFLIWPPIHDVIVVTLVNLKLLLVDARLGVQPVLIDVALLIKLLIHVGCLQKLNLFESPVGGGAVSCISRVYSR